MASLLHGHAVHALNHECKLLLHQDPRSVAVTDADGVVRTAV
jgi:hypothetical protein